MNSHDFKDPPAEYREVSFWSWNDALEPSELERQISLMAEGGWGGFFMHARSGLETRYLGESWMTCIGRCLGAARKYGLKAWLYDEETWPSGFAGGLSVAAHPSFRATQLVCHLSDRPAHIAERLVAFAIRIEAGKVTSLRPYEKSVGLGEHDWLAQFYIQRFPLGMSWYRGLCYFNALHPDAVQAFLQSTHEVYAQTFSADFGATIPGIFTDEPSPIIPLFEDDASRRWALPWVDDLPEHLKDEDILAQLPALFFDWGDFERVRYAYWRFVAKRFLMSYTGQIATWCKDNGLKLTGHLMGEDSLTEQVAWSGAVMPHYALMQQPAIDHLGRTVSPDMILKVKQLDSVASQLGKARALCESYGCSGYDFAHAGRKWIADALFVLGVNLLCPHLAPYSLRGARKRDYPPALFYQQPWWSENRLIADYTARLSYALTQGQRLVDVLVIHPLGSAWSLYRPDGGGKTAALNRALTDLLTTLVEGQRDVHLADELLLAEGITPSSVTSGAEGPRLMIGKMAYRVVIVPPSHTLEPATLTLLHAFAAAGGAVLALEPCPTRIAGVHSEQEILPKRTQMVTLETLPEFLDSILPPSVQLPQRQPLWSHQRLLDDGRTLTFIANPTLETCAAVILRLRGSDALELWNAASGSIEPLPCRQVGPYLEVTLDFAPAGSYLLLQRPGKRHVPSRAKRKARAKMVALEGPWNILSASPNALVLDTARVQIDMAPWSEPRYLLDLQESLFALERGTPFALAFVFDVTTVPASPIDLVLEIPEAFSLELNGKLFSAASSTWWLDPAFKRVRLPTLRQGENQLVLRGYAEENLALENLYLLGDFSVQGHHLGFAGAHAGQRFDRYLPSFFLEMPQAQLAASSTSGLRFDLTRQGYPFLAGRVKLRQQVTLADGYSEAQLTVQALRAAAAHVWVNGSHVGTLAWAPYSLDVTNFLHSGKNNFEIELVSTLRNLLGPHHLRGGDLTWTGPQQFRDPRRWVDDTVLVPFGFDKLELVLSGRR